MADEKIMRQGMKILVNWEKWKREISFLQKMTEYFGGNFAPFLRKKKMFCDFCEGWGCSTYVELKKKTRYSMNFFPTAGFFDVTSRSYFFKILFYIIGYLLHIAVQF